MSSIVIPHPCESIECGPFELAVLSQSQPIDETQAWTYLHPDDREWLITLKAALRRSEFLRARWILEQMQILPKSSSSRSPITGHPVVQHPWRVSITHQKGTVAVAVVLETQWKSVGIDMEDTQRVSEHLRDKIVDSTEVESLTSGLGTDWALALAFSAKESLFKCHHPIGQKMFWFHDAKITDVCADEQWLDLCVNQETSPETPAGHVTRVWWTTLEIGRKQVILTACGLHSSGS